MSDEIREQLSALLDDELNDVEQPLLLGRLERDAGLRACLGRYQLISEVMRGSGQTTTLGVANRVRQALADDAPVRMPVAKVTNRSVWLKPLAGLAVAASVALVAVLTVTSVRETNTESVPALATAQSAAAPTRVSDARGEQWDRLDPQIDKRLTGYLVNHNEYAASRGVQGVMPYVRIVGYDTNQ